MAQASQVCPRSQDRQDIRLPLLPRWTPRAQGNQTRGHYFFLKKFFSTFIYFWDRERQSMNGEGAEREGDTELETGSRLRAISPEPDTGLELTDREIVTWLKSDAQPTAPPRRPKGPLFLNAPPSTRCARPCTRCHTALYYAIDTVLQGGLYQLFWPLRNTEAQRGGVTFPGSGSEDKRGGRGNTVPALPKSC